MDRVIEKKRWSKKRILTIAGILALVGLIAASYYYTSGNSKLNVDTERITISEITKGPFQEFIPVNGSGTCRLQPFTLMQWKVAVLKKNM